jgi:hypothetical protein
MNQMKRLDDEIELVWADVERIERGKGTKAMVTFNIVYGQYNIELEDEVARKLWLRDIVIAGFKKSYSPFATCPRTDLDSEDSYTLHHHLEFLRIPDGDYIYQMKKKRDE